MNGLFDLNGKIAIVTGAGRGLGAAIARALAGAGAHVTLSGRSSGPLGETETAIREAGGRADSLLCDVTRREDVDRMIGTVETA
ncbi:SDR family NAD(P)-dependent oxidoreductase, partial [Sagittula stellata]